MSEAGESTKQRIVDTARRLFAEEGYDGATIRQIAVRAGVNVAAVNYYFGGKEALYEHVLVRAFDAMLGTGRLPPAANEAEGRAGLENLVTRLVADQGSYPADDLNRRIFAWETIQPTDAGQRLFAAGAQPHLRALAALIRSYVGEGPSDRELALAAIWLIGQCGHLRNARGFLSGSSFAPEAPDLEADPDAAVALARRLTLGGLDALRG